QRIREEETRLQKEVDDIQKEKVRDLRITERNFERQVQELKSKNQQKLQDTRQEFEEVHQSQLRKSQEAHNKNLNERIDNYTTHEEALKKELVLKEQKIREEETKLQKEVDDIQKEKVRDLRITERNFERQVQDTVVEINRTIENNLAQIRNSCNNVRVGKPVCSRGHDSNIQSYDESGYLIPSDRTGFIGHIYCPTCGTNDYNYNLRNARTLTLEE
ncbi:8767_t:CDS:2, partial [Entrophospora sp. SA101]